MPDDAIERAREAIAAGLRSWIADTHDVDLSRKMICDAVDHIVAQPGLLAFASQQAPGMEAETARLRTLAKANNDLARIEGSDRRRLMTENARLKDAIEYAHSEGFEWPSDPLAMLDAAPSVTLGEVG